MAEGIKLDALRQEVKEAGAPWEPGETSLTRMPPDERERRLGFTPPPGEPSVDELHAALESGAAAIEHVPATSVGAPAAFDLRNVGGKSYITPIKNQGGCGSCVAFGTTAVVEGTASYERRDPTLTLDLSEAQLFYCWGKDEGRNCSNGWWPERALMAYRDKGVTFEDYFPYTAGDQACNVNADWVNRNAKIGTMQQLTTTAAMKDWISTHGPLAACIIVYQDFFAYKSGIYKHVSGNQVGGHCISIVGYDDGGGFWICKNSWGTGWGESGFFCIAYGECGIETWAGPWGASGVVVTQWLNNRQVQGLWADENARNAWVYLSGVGGGWHKLSATDDNVVLTMLADMIAAKAASRPVNAFDQGGTISLAYVL
jgi:C1A family cysteine protease